jgi:hypothetical protein
MVYAHIPLVSECGRHKCLAAAWTSSESKDGQNLEIKYFWQ